MNEAIEVFVEGYDEDEVEVLDKSIVDVKLIQSTEKSFSLQIDFKEKKAISSEVTEPDVLVIKFTDPSIFVDAETGEPLLGVDIERRIKMSAQYSEAEFEIILE